MHQEIKDAFKISVYKDDMGYEHICCLAGSYGPEDAGELISTLTLKICMLLINKSGGRQLFC